jgi:hypothetical protein
MRRGGGARVLGGRCCCVGCCSIVGCRLRRRVGEGGEGGCCVGCRSIVGCRCSIVGCRCVGAARALPASAQEQGRARARRVLARGELAAGESRGVVHWCWRRCCCCSVAANSALARARKGKREPESATRLLARGVLPLDQVIKSCYQRAVLGPTSVDKDLIAEPLE